MCTLKPQMVENLFYGCHALQASRMVNAFAPPDVSIVHNRSTNLPEDVITSRLIGEY
jgi:hypothetical protein